MVHILDKASAGADDFCAAASGVFLLKTITESNEVVVDAYTWDATHDDGQNTDCQVHGPTNLVSTGGEACFACPAGKEPDLTVAGTGCVDCRPGSFSSSLSVCHECMTGASWTPLYGVGVTLASTELGWCELSHRISGLLCLINALCLIVCRFTSVQRFLSPRLV